MDREELEQEELVEDEEPYDDGEVVVRRAGQLTYKKGGTQKKNDVQTSFIEQ